MRFLRNETAFVVIDVQERIFNHLYEKEQFKNNIEILIKGMQILEVPMIFTEQYTKGLGETSQFIKDIFVWEFKAIEKMTFSCLFEEKFVEKLNSLNKKNIILAGTETQVCIQQTAIDLKAKGYNVMVIENCVTSRKKNDKETALIRLQQEGIYLSSYEAILTELCVNADSDEFKQILKIIKWLIKLNFFY